MTSNEKLTETLNDLVKINNDRIVGCEKAADQTIASDTNMQAVYLEMANESRSYIKAFNKRIKNLGCISASINATSGNIYKGWMDVKKMFNGTSKKSILESCEWEENAVQNAYKDALNTGTAMNIDVRELIIEQKAGLKKSYDIIKGCGVLQVA